MVVVVVVVVVVVIVIDDRTERIEMNDSNDSISMMVMCYASGATYNIEEHQSYLLHLSVLHKTPPV